MKSTKYFIFLIKILSIFIKYVSPTDWGGGMRKRLAKLGTDWRGIMAKEEREMIQDMENLITIDMEQTIQEDWARVERSKYCPYFKRLKTDIIMETHWTDEDKDEKKKL